MRETDFIDQNNEKWQELERLNKQKLKDPVKLSDLFIEVTNDLSFAKSYYSNRSIKVYLNNLALAIHSRIYKNRIGARNRFKAFWIEELPRIMYESRKDVLVSFLVFAISMAIGVLSSMNDPGFARHILGDSYVNMTEAYIADGDPMAVYKASKNVDMFVMIAINNLYVSFLVFVLGAFFSVGTISVLIYNGIMVGTFQYFFVERGLFQESFLTIWLHGMPEIMSIVLAGAAGLTLGRGLIFPGTYARKESFLIAARRGIMIMVGISPVFIFAAFIEGFATRYTEMPDLIRGIVITLSGSFMIYYFVIYPWLKYGRGVAFKETSEKLPEAAIHEYKLDKDKRNPEIYTDIFSLYSRAAFYLFPRFLGMSIIYVTALILTAGEGFDMLFTSSRGIAFDMFSQAINAAFIKVDQLFRYQSSPFLYVFNSLYFAVVVTISLRIFKNFLDRHRGESRGDAKTFTIQNFAWIALISFVCNLLFFIPTPWSFLLMIAVIPTMMMIACNRALSGDRKLSRSEGVKLITNGYVRSLGLFSTTMVTAILFILIFNSGLIDLLLEVTLWNFKMEESTFNLVMLALRSGLTILALSMVSPLFVFGACFLYFSLHEIDRATGLQEDIGRIGTHKRAYGFVKEDA